MEKSQTGKRHEIESTVEAQVILRHGSHADLCQISHRCEEGHAAEGKILVHAVVEPKAERERRIVGGAGPESEICRKPPARLLRIRRSREVRCQESKTEHTEAGEVYGEQMRAGGLHVISNMSAARTVA